MEISHYSCGVKRSARFYINREDDLESEVSRILVVVASEFPEGKGFGIEELTRRLQKESERNPESVLTKRIHFHPTYKDSKILREVLHPQGGFGALLGFKNIGPDFIYSPTGKTKEIAEEINRLNLFDKSEMDYLKEFGRRFFE